MKNFKDWITESPARAKMIGKGWDDKKSGNYYDPPSMKFLTSPSGLERIETKFNKTPFKFRLFFLKQKGAANYNERGEVTSKQLDYMLNVDLSSENIEDDEITIIFTGNKAAEKVPLTPWTIAHRIGHTIRRTKGFLQSGNNWEQMIYDFKSSLIPFLNFAYDKDFNIRDFQFTSPHAKIVAHILGTMRSARLKKINRPYEFLFELFAQYIIEGGVKLNRDIPKKFKANGEMWILDYSDYGIDIDMQNMEELLDSHFSRILSDAQGKIFIM